MGTTDRTQEQIIDEFAMLDQWMDKYEYLIELANELPELDPKHRIDQYLINGCQSRVWLDVREEGGHMFFGADSDAIITKGIISLLIKVLNGRTPKEVLETELYFIDRIGLSENLSPTRSNGVVAMVKQMKLFALALESRAKEPLKRSETDH